MARGRISGQEGQRLQPGKVTSDRPISDISGSSVRKPYQYIEIHNTPITVWSAARLDDPRIGKRQMRKIREYVQADQLIYEQVREQYEANGRVPLGHYGSNSERSIFLVRDRAGNPADVLRARVSTMYDVVLLRCFGWGAGYDACGFPKERIYQDFDEAWIDLTGKPPVQGWKSASGVKVESPPSVASTLSITESKPVIPETRAI